MQLPKEYKHQEATQRTHVAVIPGPFDYVCSSSKTVRIDIEKQNSDLNCLHSIFIFFSGVCSA
jgi:hypothetical protein